MGIIRRISLLAYDSIYERLIFTQEPYQGLSPYGLNLTANRKELSD